MAKFATYGMAGIGIAAAIGFVFALSLASNNNAALTGSNPAQQPAAPFSTLQQKSQPQSNSDDGSNASLPSGQETSARMKAAINNESADNQQARTDLRPTLTSLIALNTSREVIGEIAPEMQFKLGTPVLIQANFANDNEVGILQHTISMEVKSQNGISSTAAQNESFASFKGDIAKDANVALDLYWQPSRTGEFTILVFSTTPEDSTSTISTAPVAAIPVKVIE